MTLVELVVVIVVLVALAGLVVPMTTGVTDQSRIATTRANMALLQDVIMNRYWNDMNGLAGLDGYPQPIVDLLPPTSRPSTPQLRYLFVTPDPTQIYNAATRRGWNGPYLQHNGSKYVVNSNFTVTYGLDEDPTILDGWGNPIIIQRPTAGADVITNRRYTRLVSAGPNGVIDTSPTLILPSQNSCKDDLVLYLAWADERPLTD